jgi:acyl-CoA thioesterase II
MQFRSNSMNLLGTVAKALGNSRRVAMMASLDHSMWFYEPFDFNKPLLFFMQCQVATNGRGLAMGRFYSEDGTLLAVVVSPSSLFYNAYSNSFVFDIASRKKV